MQEHRRQRTAGETLADRFDRVVRPHIPALYRFAWYLSGSGEDAEDLVQDVMIKLFPRLDELEALDNPVTWMKRVLYNRFVDLHRRRREVEAPDMPDQDADALQISEAYGGADRGPEESVGQQESDLRVRTALARLDAEERALVSLHIMEGHKLSDLTEVFELPEGTLKSRLHRARAKLKKALKVEPFASAQNVG